MRARSEFTAGIFLICAMLLFGLSIWVLGREREIFARLEPYQLIFKDVKGLAVGAPVRLGGITVGRVAEIGFAKELTDTNVHVKLLINDQFLERIHIDSTANIETQGLLGDRFVNLSAGMAPSQLLPGATIRTVESDDLGALLSKASRVVDNTVEIADNVNAIFKELKTDTIKSFTEASKNVAAITHEVRDGKGLVHDLIYSDERGKSIMRDLEEASHDLKSIVRRVRSGEGLLHAMVFDREGGEMLRTLSKASASLGSASERIGEIAREITEGKGMLHTMVYADSPEGLQTFIQKLNQTADNLHKASAALADGSGTIGALLVDPQLYDNLVEITDEAKRSFILREAIKGSLQK